MNPKRIFWALWGVFGLLLLYWVARLWGHFPAFMDTIEYVFPEKWFNVESFRQGRIPLWNPYIACGTPHLAAFQPAPFYPPFWLWNLTGLTDWFFVLALLHVAGAAWGFYLWARSLKAHPLLAVLCALGFAGSAMMTFYWGFPTHLASVAWVPWIFYSTVLWEENPTLARWFFLTLSWAFHILAGYPIFTFYALLFWVAWVLWRTFQTPESPTKGFLNPKTRNFPFKKELFWGAAASFVAALGVTACQWLPFMDYWFFLHREGKGEYLYNLDWTNYLTLFQPQLLGVPGTEGYKGNYPAFIFNNFYLGLVPLGLLVYSFFSPRQKGFFWKGSALFWFLWPAGRHFLPWEILGSWTDRLEPAKAVFLFTFCAFSALALGWGQQMSSYPRKSWVWTWTWVLGATWLVDILFVPCRVVPTVPDPYRDPQVKQAASRALELSGDKRIASLREAGKIFPQEGGTLAGSVMETAAQLVPNTNVVWGLRSARGYLTIYTDGFQDLNRYLEKGYPYSGRVLDAAGVGLVIFSRSLPDFKYSLWESHGSSIWTRNAGAEPSAWEVEKVKEFPDRPSVFEALLDPKAFLEEEVFTQRAADAGAVCLKSSPRFLPGGGPSWTDQLGSFWGKLWGEPLSIGRERSSPCEARFEIKNGHPGFLVFDESYSPGWHAWVDGQPKDIFRADGLFMTVPLAGEGDHRVVFKYEPGSFRLGLFLSILFLLAGAVVFVRPRKPFNS